MYCAHWSVWRLWLEGMVRHMQENLGDFNGQLHQQLLHRLEEQGLLLSQVRGDGTAAAGGVRGGPAPAGSANNQSWTALRGVVATVANAIGPALATAAGRPRVRTAAHARIPPVLPCLTLAPTEKIKSASHVYRHHFRAAFEMHVIGRFSAAICCLMQLLLWLQGIPGSAPELGRLVAGALQPYVEAISSQAQRIQPHRIRSYQPPAQVACSMHCPCHSRLQLRAAVHCVSLHAAIQCKTVFLERGLE